MIAEIAHLAAGGIREINLLGQNVNAYRGDNHLGRNRRLCRIAARRRPHPRDRAYSLYHIAPGGILRCPDGGLRGHPQLVDHLHLPVRAAQTAS